MNNSSKGSETKDAHLPPTPLTALPSVVLRTRRLQTRRQAKRDVQPGLLWFARRQGVVQPRPEPPRLRRMPNRHERRDGGKPCTVRRARKELILQAAHDVNRGLRRVRADDRNRPRPRYRRERAVAPLVWRALDHPRAPRHARLMRRDTPVPGPAQPVVVINFAKAGFEL
jgi:hypothetical protein